MFMCLYSLISIAFSLFLVSVTANEHFENGYDCGVMHKISECIESYKTALTQDQLTSTNIRKNESHIFEDKMYIKWLSISSQDFLWTLHVNAAYSIVVTNGTTDQYVSRPTFLFRILPKCNESLVFNDSPIVHSVTPKNLQYFEEKWSSQDKVNGVKIIYLIVDNECSRITNSSSIIKGHFKIQEKYLLLNLRCSGMEERAQKLNAITQRILLPKYCLKYFEIPIIFNLPPKKHSSKQAKRFVISSGIDSELIIWFKKFTGWKIETVERTFHAHSNVILTEIANGSVNTRFHLYVMTAERYKTVDFTVPLAQNPLCVLLRRAPNMPFTVVLRLPYQPFTWLCIGITFLSCSFIWYILHCVQDATRRRQHPATRRRHHGLWRSVFDVTQILLNGACTRQGDTFGQRLFLEVIVMITMVLTNAYSGQLLGFFAAPPHYDNPRTLDEAVSATRHLYSDKDYHFVMGNKDASDAMRKFLRKFSVDTDLLTRLHSIVQSRDDAYLLTHDRYLQYKMYKNLTRHGKQLLYQVPECMITPGNVGYPVTKNIPEYDVLNQFTLRVLEGGLYSLRAIREQNQLTGQGVLIPSSSQSREPKAMTLDQFSASLFVLAVGLGVSSVAFIIEFFRLHLKIYEVFLL